MKVVKGVTSKEAPPNAVGCPPGQGRARIPIDKICARVVAVVDVAL